MCVDTGFVRGPDRLRRMVSGQGASNIAASVLLVGAVSFICIGFYAICARIRRGPRSVPARLVFALVLLLTLSTVAFAVGVAVP